MLAREVQGRESSMERRGIRQFSNEQNAGLRLGRYCNSYPSFEHNVPICLLVLYRQQQPMEKHTFVCARYS